jgi:hypothetical protein
MVDTGPENSREPPRPERRQHPRKKVGVKIELHLEGNRIPLRTKATDLTLGGCYVEMMFTLEVGTKLNVDLWMNDVKLSTGGIVVTRFHNRGNGIQFTKLAAEDQARLKQFLTVAPAGTGRSMS